MSPRPRTNKKRPVLPDAEERRLILEELARNLLVEAAAGTGKTTSMVGRMAALLRTGRCERIRSLAAVTFTRKAAAELRTRFQLELEQAVSAAEGEEQARLARALQEIDQCFIGTIHSFCGRLLRERPVEAQVDVDFVEIDEEEDQRLRKEAWDDYLVRLLADDPEGTLAKLDALGLRIGDLEGSFMRFAGYPDVDEWPTAETSEPPPLDETVRQTNGYLRHMEQLRPRLPATWGNDKIIPEYRRLPRIASHYDLSDPAQLAELLARFDRSCSPVQKEWMKEGFSREDAKAEGQRWEDFRADIVRPFLSAWRERRYALVMQILHEARARYNRLREARGQLNFQDLLMKAAALLRQNAHVRAYFQERYTHLLVDEFQDTDPIQAEVMLLLTASDLEERDWRRCHPRPGSLFVVGDPKQSIYRFRRADIVTYNEVKEIIRGGDEEGGGLILELSTNFRSTPSVISWVNDVFASRPEGDESSTLPRFPASSSAYSPAYVTLYPERDDAGDGELGGVYALRVPEEHSARAQCVPWEADMIARLIRAVLDGEGSVPRSGDGPATGRPGRATPADFMILTRTRADLSVYAQRLRAYGIPHRVTGGSALNEVPEVKLLATALRAVIRDDDPVALVAVLRSELFGVSDVSLYRFKKAGGHFTYRGTIPEGLPAAESSAFSDAYARLRRYRQWLEELPALAAIERVIADLGLTARAAGRDGGDMDAGSLARCLELLRAARSQMWTPADLVAYLGEIAQMTQRFDGVSARPEGPSVVCVMNLHQAKGLEAPVVFLANPRGDTDHPVELHIDRSGERVLGYMALSRQSGQFQSECLAHPPRWSELEAEERRFLEAENLRLRYVAATRAGRALIVTELAKRNGNNPWRFFDAFLPAGLDDPGEQPTPEMPVEEIPEEQPAEAEVAVAARLERASTSTYETRRAKEYALAVARPVDTAPVAAPVEAPTALAAEGEQGTEWGSVIHLLLSVAARDANADLGSLARAVLEQQELAPDLADAAIEMVHSVTRSDIWARASASERWLTEVPFVIAREERAVPVLVKGAVDLAFREGDGWVLVDYKTDAVPEGGASDLAARYAPQLQTYAEAWERCTGEPVRETCFYFVRASAVVVVPR